MVSKNTICLWFNGTALDAAQFYAETFTDSAVGAIHHAPSDYPAGKQGDVLSALRSNARLRRLIFQEVMTANSNRSTRPYDPHRLKEIPQ